MSVLNLATANRIIEGAFEHAEKLQLKPLTVAVLDAGGHVIALQRQDGSSIARAQIAIGKAAGALALGVSSRKIAEMAVERPTFINALAPLAPAGIIPAAGGVVVVGAEGRTAGAVGVTGDLSDNDESCALAGLAAVRLAAL
ncbi:MAG TPA: heme-binding protein [Steroidobacter sp.]|uniref:GlcG/HbpS family heme-binding protein n=1 Tax=Steroidobacter sp. TaxID=1978227 RepID=UPI002EDA96DB